MLMRIGVFARLAIIALALVFGLVAGGAFRGFTPSVIAAEEKRLDGLVAKVDGNVLYMVLNYGPLQAVDITPLAPEERAMLVVGQWVELFADADGERFTATHIIYAGICVSDAEQVCLDPGAIGGTANADAVIAEALGQPLPALVPAGFESSPSDNGEECAEDANDNGDGCATDENDNTTDENDNSGNDNS